MNMTPPPPQVFATVSSIPLVYYRHLAVTSYQRIDHYTVFPLARRLTTNLSVSKNIINKYHLKINLKKVKDTRNIMYTAICLDIQQINTQVSLIIL